MRKLCCPACSAEIAGRPIIVRPALRTLRVCPQCARSISVDPTSKGRQLIALFLGVVSLYATIQLFIDGGDWFSLAAASNFVFGIFVFYADAQVLLIEDRTGVD